jgi:hypothetical protein
MPKDYPPHPLVQTKLTKMEDRKKRAAAAKSVKPAKASSPKESQGLINIDDSSSDSDNIPRVAG